MKLNKAEKMVKKFKEENPDLNKIGCHYAIDEKLFGGSFQDRFIPPEYERALIRFYKQGGDND